MVFTNISPYQGTMTPITNISPLTYRDASTFLEYLEEIRNWLNNTLVPDTNTLLSGAVAEFDTIRAGWDARFDYLKADLTAQIALLNEAAVAGLVDTGTVHTKIVALIDGAIATVRAAITAETDAKVAAVTARLDSTDYGYLVSAFTANGAYGEQLSVFYSPDGKTVFGGGANQVYADPNTGNSLRDPSTLKIGDTWYTAYTVNNGINQNFAVIKSPDLLTWTPVTIVDVSSIANISRAWAPELVQDTNGDVYVFLSAMTSTFVGSTHYVKATNSNLSAWSAPVALTWTNGPSNIIDPTFVHSGNVWYCFYKNEDSKYVERATSPTLTGTYTVDRSGNWAGWGSGVEGPEIVHTPSGVWRLYMDRYITNSGYMYAESADLNTWTGLTPISVGAGVLPADQHIRHGSFVRLTDQQSATAAMSAALGKPRRHGEFSVVGTVPANTIGGPGTLTPFHDPTYSNAVASFLTLPAPSQVRVEVSGVYSVSWVCQHVGTPAGATTIDGAFMAIKSPDQTQTYATADIVPTSGESSVSFPKKYLEAGTVIQFFCKFGNTMDPLNSHIVIDKE